MVLKELYRDADGDEVNQINDFLMCTDTANNVWGKKKKEDAISTTVDCPKDWAM